MITIGNIKGVSKSHQITVFRALDHKPYLQVVMSSDAVHKCELMGEHYLQTTFPYIRDLDMKIGDYCTYQSVKFALMADYKPEQVNEGEFKFLPKFEAPDMFFKNAPNFYTLQGFKELEWHLRAQPERFMQLFVDNVNEFYNEDWKVGNVEATELLDMSFNNSYVFGGLTDLAEKTECEWYVNYKLKTINLVKRLKRGEEFELKSSNFLTSVRKDSQSKEFCTRLYAFGSNKNLPTNYRTPITGEAIDAIVQKRLRMPLSVGDYIDVRPNLKPHEIVPKFVNFDVFPQRVGTITEIRETLETDENGNKFSVFRFKDSGIDFHSKYILPNEPLRCVFQDGFMGGFDRELNYNDKTKEYEIINEQIGETLVPNSLLKPSVGDKYILYNFNIDMVGNQYVPEAEKELEKQAREYLIKMFENGNDADSDLDTYICSLDPVEVGRTKISIPLGQNITIVSDVFKGGRKNSRVYGFTKYPVTYKYELLVGDNPKYSRTGTIAKTVENNKKETDVQIADMMRQTRASLSSIKALNYIKTALVNETTIDGGLIQNTTLLAGLLQGDVWVNTGGLNGVYENDDDIYLWGGGTLDQAVNLVKNPGATEDVANFVVTHGGKVIQNQALIRGRFESNSNGGSVVIDDNSRSIKLYSNREGGGLSGEWVTTDIIGETSYPSSRLRIYGDSSRLESTELHKDGVTIYKDDGTQSHLTIDGLTFRGKNFIDLFSISTKDDKLNINTKEIARNPIGLYYGDWWVDENGDPHMVVE